MIGEQRALVITGATATGKTKLSLVLAGELPIEIISMDSRQVYRGMDIGTGKATAQERARVRHWGLDVASPGQAYSAGSFARDARRWIRTILARGRLPVLVGGTGFFLRALIQPLFAEPRVDGERRRVLRRYLDRLDPSRLISWVRALDPERSDLAIEGGRQRMTRTIEVALLTGRPLSAWHKEAPSTEPPLATDVAVVELPRDELSARIAARVRRMVEDGLVEEVRGLLDAGHSPDSPGMTAVGYREIAAHLAGRSTLDEAVDAMVRATRRYARRQLTWFRNQLPDDAVRIDGTAALDDQVRAVREVWPGEAGSACRP